MMATEQHWYLDFDCLNFRLVNQICHIPSSEPPSLNVGPLTDLSEAKEYQQQEH